MSKHIIDNDFDWDEALRKQAIAGGFKIEPESKGDGTQEDNQEDEEQMDNINHNIRLEQISSQIRAVGGMGSLIPPDGGIKALQKELENQKIASNLNDNIDDGDAVKTCIPDLSFKRINSKSINPSNVGQQHLSRNPRRN